MTYLASKVYIIKKIFICQWCKKNKLIDKLTLLDYLLRNILLTLLSAEL